MHRSDRSEQRGAGRGASAAAVKEAAAHERVAATAPAYRRIELDLRTKLRSGVWPLGTMLPSRQSLARDYGVDLSTVQRAISALLEEGTLRADNGRGTFVARPLPEEQAAAAAEAGDGAGAAVLAPPRAPGSLGLMCRLPNPTDFWPRAVLHALEQSFAESGAATHFVNLWPLEGVTASHVAPGAAASRLFEAGVEGIVLVGVRDDAPLSARDAVELAGAAGGDTSRLVVVSSGPLDLPVAHVFYDQQYAGFLAARHLIERGHRGGLLFLAPFDAAWVHGRIEGARQAVRLAGLPDDALTVWPPRDGGDGRDGIPPFDPGEPAQEDLAAAAARALLARGGAAPAAAAVIAANDRLARAFAAALRAEAGREPGRDYALVGFDDEPESRALGLTSLRPPLEELGREAAGLLLRSLRGEAGGLQVRLRSQLVPRASTAGALPPPL